MITSFSGENRFLSNFWICDIYDGKYTKMMFPTVENAYQACKTLDEEFWKMLVICTPGQAKRLGRKCPMRPDWDAIKEDVMTSLLAVKFQPGSELANKLIATDGQILIEGNTWGDKYWGCELLPDGTVGDGENRLGIILMGIRTLLIELKNKGQ